jgi:hypothetical protein
MPHPFSRQIGSEAARHGFDESYDVKRSDELDLDDLSEAVQRCGEPSFRTVRTGLPMPGVGTGDTAEAGGCGPTPAGVLSMLT